MMMRKQDDYVPLAYKTYIERRVQRSWGNTIYIGYPARSEKVMDILKKYDEEEWRKVKASSYRYYSTRLTPTVENAEALCQAFKDATEAGCDYCKTIYRHMKSNAKEYIFEIQYRERKVEFDAMVSKIS
jgi:hypothetical protein